jgi:hypothetical protein
MSEIEMKEYTIRDGAYRDAAQTMKFDRLELDRSYVVLDIRDGEALVKPVTYGPSSYRFPADRKETQIRFWVRLADLIEVKK